MDGKVCLVTGGTSGVGRAIALGAAQLGATVIVPARDLTRATEIVETAREGGGEVIPLSADLSSQAQVRALSEEVCRRFDRIDVVSANAAVLLPRREESEEGIEKTLAVNYLSHFLLINRLAGPLRAGGSARVIVVSGGPGVIARVQLDFGDLQLKRGYSAIKATIRAAAAKVLFTFELARRMEDAGVVAHTFHPGGVRSRLGRHLPSFIKPFYAVANVLMSDRCDEGLRLISTPEPATHTGAFYSRGRPVAFRFRRLAPDAGARLWSLSEELCGEQFSD
jgi:NAD(P)-dependent dehydrogenase (short-subunit alcohol dehydrogenase family)